jgi:hypothetical protein
MKTHNIADRTLLSTIVGAILILSTIAILSVANPHLAMAQTQDQMTNQSIANPSMPFSSFPGTVPGLPMQTSPATINNMTEKLTLNGAFGISMVKGVRITGITENDLNNTVTVTLSSNATGNSPAVTIQAMRMNFNLATLIQQAMRFEMMKNAMAEERGQTNASSTMMPREEKGSSGMMENSSQNMMLGAERGSSSPFNMLSSMFKNMERGSNVLQQGWTTPQQVSIMLENNNTSLQQSRGDSTIVAITVVPFTGGQNMTATTTTTTNATAITPTNNTTTSNATTTSPPSTTSTIPPPTNVPGVPGTMMP